MKPHNKRLTQWNKKQRQFNRIKLALGVLVSIILLTHGSWLAALLLLVILYVLQELFWSDHLFYNPRQDYSYQFEADLTDDIDLSDNTINWKQEYLKKTVVLELDLKSTLRGIFFDPYIEIITAKNRQRQYFERRLSGVRFVNLSHSCSNESCSALFLKFVGCRPAHEKVRLYGFSNDSLQGKKILVIAPHADDAEIAGFGLYSQNDSFIITLTAGETEAEYYEDATTDKVNASRFKGRLRSWDSIAVPQWAGLAADRVIQLGYFCLTLGKMYRQPDQQVQSFTADLKDTRFFRAYNNVTLQSDSHGRSTWNSLLEDLTELIVKVQPDMIITPHPQLDPHKDHYYATLACWQVCNKLAEDELHFTIDAFLLYANHYNHTDTFPFGLSGSLLSLPPEFDQRSDPVSMYSFATEVPVQKNKRAALGMMHDLTTPLPVKKKFRHWIQHLVLFREKYIYGDDEYFRKAIRANELFFKVNLKQLGRLVNKN